MKCDIERMKINYMFYFFLFEKVIKKLLIFFTGTRKAIITGKEELLYGKNIAFMIK